MTQGMLIDGQLVVRDETLPVVNPSDGREFERVSCADRNDVSKAIEAAYSGHQKLSELPLHARTKLLTNAAQRIRERIDELATGMTRETGKLLRDSKAELTRTAFIFEQAAIEARRIFEGVFQSLDAFELPAGNENRVAFTLREPLGVVAGIIPFNFPAAAFAHKVAPALATGNSILLKPSILAPITALKIGKIVNDTGFPRGAVNVITGQSSEIGDEITNHRLVNLITFTGSSQTGLEIASRAIKQGKRVIMELGGSDPMIVLEDADVDHAAKVAAKARFDYSGQFCNSTKRLIVRNDVADQFVSRLSDITANLRLGDPTDPSVDIGPVISKTVIDELDRAVGDAVSKGGKLIAGGARAKRPGFFYLPTIIDKTPLSAVPLTDEIFAPLAPVVRVQSDEEALTVANSLEYGLDAAIFSRDFPRAYRLARKIRTGTVMINDSTRLRWDSLPFGGVKKSGIGREGMRDTMLEMTEGKLVVVNVGAN